MTYLKTLLNTKKTPQSEPIPGSAQVANSAGGYTFAVDDWTRLARFLVLGAEGGSYYASERKLSLDNAEAVKRCIASDGPRVVREIVAVSEAGRAPKNDPALFALAMCAAFGDEDTRRKALASLPAVARIGTHLFHFAEYVDGMRGWGRGLRQAVGNWYAALPADKLAYQAIKYGQRDGWSHRDLLRLSHPKPETEQHFALYHWLTQGWNSVGEMPHPDPALRLVWASERAKTADSAAQVAGLIRDYRLPREAVPTQWLTEPSVWEALLEDMPMTALIRNLATLTRIGLVSPGSEAAHKVVAELTNESRLRKARVHPIAVLSALKTYAQGYGERGGNTWNAVPAVVDALDAAFYASFASITPTGKRWLLALDVSGSMQSGRIAGVPGLTPRIASAAMALITAGTETQHQFMAFSTTFVPLAISPRQRLDDVLKTVSGLPFSGTDCALPMVWALKNKVATDVFVVYTDSETWAGGIQPVQALREYRDRMGIPAKLIVCGMVSNAFTIADLDDAGMLDVVGFDTSTPALMGDFAVA
ncbi:MAG: TROVE domain-containing protein [Janthinobacterium lividum]